MQAPGYRLNGRQRIIQLVTHYTNQALPGEPLFFPQSPAHIGKNHQSVRHSSLPKRTSPYKPARIAVEVQRDHRCVLGEKA
jgi:hypothetical protein